MSFFRIHWKIFLSRRSLHDLLCSSLKKTSVYRKSWNKLHKKLGLFIFPKIPTPSVHLIPLTYKTVLHCKLYDKDTFSLANIVFIIPSREHIVNWIFILNFCYIDLKFLNGSQREINAKKMKNGSYFTGNSQNFVIHNRPIFVLHW